MEDRRGKKGIVVSVKNDKTAVVLIKRTVFNSLYKKEVLISSKFSVHDENNVCSVGDEVFIRECRPISSKKRWMLSSVINKKTNEL